MNFVRADLTCTRLIRARLEGARLQGADLTGANLSGATLTEADLTGARWPQGVRVPEGWMVDSESGRLKPAGQLSEVTVHYPDNPPAALAGMTVTSAVIFGGKW